MGLKSGKTRSSLRNVQVGNKIPDSVIDNFESSIYEDQNRNLSDVYDGDLTAFARSTNIVAKDNYSLECNGNTEFIYSKPANDTLGHYPSSGEKFKFYTYHNNSDSPFAGMMFGYNGSNSFYYCECRPSTIEIFKDGFTGSNSISSSSVSGSANTWLIVELEWYDDGTITAEAFSTDSNNDKDASIGSTTGTDTSYSDGGAGWAGRSSGVETYLDESKLISTL